MGLIYFSNRNKFIYDNIIRYLTYNVGGFLKVFLIFLHFNLVQVVEETVHFFCCVVSRAELWHGLLVLAWARVEVRHGLVVEQRNTVSVCVCYLAFLARFVQHLEDVGEFIYCLRWLALKNLLEPHQDLLWRKCFAVYRQRVWLARNSAH